MMPYNCFHFNCIQCTLKGIIKNNGMTIIQSEENKLKKNRKGSFSYLLLTSFTAPFRLLFPCVAEQEQLP